MKINWKVFIILVILIFVLLFGLFVFEILYLLYIVDKVNYLFKDILIVIMGGGIFGVFF